MKKFKYEYIQNNEKKSMQLLAQSVDRAERTFIRIQGKSGIKNRKIKNLINLLWDNMILENSLIDRGGGLPVTRNHFYPEIMEGRYADERLKSYLDHDQEELWCEIEEQFVSGAYIGDIKKAYPILDGDCEV
jgi:hypothetical protein